METAWSFDATLELKHLKEAYMLLQENMYYLHSLARPASLHVHVSFGLLSILYVHI